MNIEMWVIIVSFLVSIYVYLEMSSKIEAKKRRKRLEQDIKINRVERKVKETEKIHSLEMSKSIERGFVLGTGNIDDELRYYFYVDKDKGKQIKSINAEECVIVEGAKTPKIEYLDYNFKENWTIDNLKDIDLNINAYLYVPKNTIKKVFRGNLEK